MHRVQQKFLVPFASYYLNADAQIWFGMIRRELDICEELKQLMNVKFLRLNSMIFFEISLVCIKLVPLKITKDSLQGYWQE